MSIGVIVLFEIIHIDEDKRNRIVVSIGAGYFLTQSFLKIAVAKKAG